MIAVIRATTFRPDGVGTDSGWPVGALAPGEWLWLDVSDESVAELATITAAFEFDPLALEDAMADSHIPMFDDYGAYLFVVLHGLRSDDDRLATGEVDAFLGSDYLVTVHTGSATVDWMFEQVTDGAMASNTGPDGLLALIADVQSRRLLRVIDALDEAMFSVEERALSGDASVLSDIQSLRRDTTLLRRAVSPLRDVLRDLSTSDSTLLGVASRRRFDSAYDHVNRLVEGVDTARVLIAASLDTYRSTVAEKTNDVMRVLTVYSALLLPLTLIVGLYGMNFANMPELQWRNGYFWLLGMMMLLAAGQWFYFYRRGFIGRPSARILGRPASLLAQVAKLPLQPAMALVAMARRPTDPEG